jgi:hypothetical protein
MDRMVLVGRDHAGDAARPAPGNTLQRRALAVSLLLGLGCAPADPGVELAASAFPIVYGADDRREIFEVPEALQSVLARSTVSFIANERLDPTSVELLTPGPSFGEAANLCVGEPFAEQPAAAFCSGVLVDWDLVLTAGHCLRVRTLDDFSVVLGYHYTGGLALAARPIDVLTPLEIVHERLDVSGQEPRLDYGWLRLAEAARAPYEPAAVGVEPFALQLGDTLHVVSAVGGAPLKVDTGGAVHETRASLRDYFVADTDTAGGSSGGPAFDREAALVGVLARGGADLEMTPAGCQSTRYVANDDAAEEFTYAEAARRGLCDLDPGATSLCRADCGNPCRALPRPDPRDATSCAAAPPGRGARVASAALLAALLAQQTLRRVKKRVRTLDNRQ